MVAKREEDIITREFQTTQENIKLMGSTHKSLLSKLRETEMDNPLKKNPIYATLKFNEIMQDMRAEDFRAIEVQKHRK